MDAAITQVYSPTDPGFRTLAEVYRADNAARNPADPVIGDAAVAAEVFKTPPDRVVLHLVAEIGGAPAGHCWSAMHTRADGEVRMAEIDLFVLAEHRRRGVATALLQRMVPMVVERDQNSVIAYPCPDLWPDEGRGLCERLGLTPRQDERCSRALVADIDEVLLQRWIDEAASRAGGYRLESWEGMVPDHLGEAWSVAAAGMEDIPLDGVEFEPVTRTPEQQAEADAVYLDRGFRLHRTLALSEDGEAAGLTMIYVNAAFPEVAHQDDTAVLAAHRGNGIGRWLKAVNYRQVALAHPELAVVETYNAESNPWMLDINVAMGFKPHLSYVAYQGSLDGVVAALAEVDR